MQQVFETERLGVEYKFVYPDVVTYIEWSPDDNFIFAVIGKKN